MPSDIRSFFGGKSSQSQSSAQPPKTKPAAKRTRASRKVIDDSEEEDDAEENTPAQKPATRTASKKEEPAHEGEAISKDDYFGKSKPKRTNDARNPPKDKPRARKEKPDASPAKSTNSRGSTRTTPNAKSTRANDHDMLDDMVLDDHTFDSGAEDPKARPVRKAAPGRVPKYADDYEAADDAQAQGPPNSGDADEMEVCPAVPVAQSTKGRKRKSAAIASDDDDGDEFMPLKEDESAQATTRKPPAKKVKKEEVEDSAEVRAILESIPLVRPPTPPIRDGETGKFQFGTHTNSGPAPAEGSKEMPEGAENCLAGLTFVFTGLLQSISREVGQELVKRYGGKCPTTPSSKTSFVVLGSDAGPKKLDTIAKFGLKTIDEDGLFALIRKLPANGGDSKAGALHAQKQQQQMDQIKAQAAEIEEAERAAAKAASQKAGSASGQATVRHANAAPNGVDSRLWTVKYAPNDLKQICGNRSKVEVLQRWLRAFPKNQKKGFKVAGPDLTGIYRAVIISGPPGIGKTTAAHLVAKLEGYDIVESNASDSRSKKLVDTGLKGVLDTTSLLGYFAGDGEQANKSKRKLVLIMDEVDGMSAGDRGGAGALSALCKKSNIPMILICNDRKLPKMKTFDHVAFNMPFIRPTTDMIRSRIMTIAFREGMKLPLPVINALIEGTGADIRQVVNMLSSVKLDSRANGQELNYDDSKQMSKAWEKFAVLKPWDTIHKILSTGMFTQASTATLNDKSALYFNDHSINPLFLQENYLNTNPILAQSYSGRERTLKNLELVEKAASSISEGDLVDRMIHGQQQWTLMPAHAIMSFVRPASFVAGSMAGHQSGFPAWMGKNSTQQKLMRLIREIQGHMRLRCSADRHAIRQYYLPLLWAQLVKRLELDGKDVVPEVIKLMDFYYLTRDDWDAILELGIGPMIQDNVKVDSQTKAAFTRQYNSQSHPMPFMKASTIGALRNAAKEKPDLEEAFEESDGAESVADVKAGEDEDDELDLGKDKYVQAPKKKKVAAKGKGKKNELEDAGDDDDVPASKTGKSKAAAKGKGKGRK